MKLIKYKMITGLLILLGNGSFLHAEQINFQGEITEDTCSMQTKNETCLTIQKTVALVQLSEKNNGEGLSKRILKLDKQPKGMATLNIQKIENTKHKILLVSYF